MNRYLKLVHYELFRFRKIYFSLFLIVLLVQFSGLYIFAKKSLNTILEGMARFSQSGNGLPPHEVTGLDRFCNSLWFMAPIALCVAALILYVFLIWYRDWVGKNMFIYRLLMLPSSRSYIYTAKLSVILILVLGMVAFQLLILPLQNAAFNSLIPAQYRATMTIFRMITHHQVLKILIPPHFIEFLLYYAAGVMGVILVFTGILLERSYRLKGAFVGILYCALAVFLFLLPVIVAETAFPNYLYPVEIISMEAAVGLLISGASLWFSIYLLNKKVTV